MNGTVFQTITDNSKQQYVVLPDGVAKVNDTTAAALRATLTQIVAGTQKHKNALQLTDAQIADVAAYMTGGK